MANSEYKKYLDKIDAEEKRMETVRQRHKCFKCFYGRWTGVKYFCMLPECKR